jgi:hypothetical protein
VAQLNNYAAHQAILFERFGGSYLNPQFVMEERALLLVAMEWCNGAQHYPAAPSPTMLLLLLAA